MNEAFKINMYFDEKGEKIEKLISHVLINNEGRRQNASKNKNI